MSSLKEFKRLKSNREFQKVYRKAKRWNSNSLISFYQPSKLKLVGFTASKKSVGNAIKRNRAKRRVRALFIEYGSKLKSGVYIFVSKSSTIEVEYKDLKRDFLYNLKKLDALK